MHPGKSASRAIKTEETLTVVAWMEIVVECLGSPGHEKVIMSEANGWRSTTPVHRFALCRCN
jgi:hypothetical protein